MKYYLTVLCTFAVIVSFGRNATFEKLSEVNKCWLEQRDVDRSSLPQIKDANERQWIALHLSLVEKTLRARDISNLSIAQQHNRVRCLDHLHEYWQQKRFPVNEDYSYRTPIFIDKHDNFCAVGYLVKTSGHEEISRMIAANTNLAYVRQMKYPQLQQWANEYGFTIDELAWIQPGYEPTGHSKPIGNGVDGSVNELYVDVASGKLYVGGRFANADSTLLANNIAYVTQAGDAYTWHNMGIGVNGQVNAITRYGNNIFVAGSFTTAGGDTVNNVAYWNDTDWHGAGCISGIVNDLIVFNDTLYAAGSFSMCPTSAEVNFAKWNGSAWIPIPGINGTVNTMHVMDTTLLFGGAFTYATDTLNIIKWNATSGFSPFLNSIKNEVKDIAIYQDSAYAVCKRTNFADSNNLLLKLRGNGWNPAYTGAGPFGVGGIFNPANGLLSFNTLCPQTTSLEIGGQFSYVPFIGDYGDNCYSVGSDYFAVDSAVNKMVVFNSCLVAGGKFKKGGNTTDHVYRSVQLNGMAKKDLTYLSIPKSVEKTLTFYPNPVDHGLEITVSNNFNADHFIITDIASKVLKEGNIVNDPFFFVVSGLTPGLYFIDISNSGNERVVRKFVVQ